ncbi:uncharacterized protein ARMOST_10176 [Armillaria ostoyae]|uniref:Uncharacterized protein n=1 Tax=Armillaria ostoyae TaxID=47428 RepID=A0A284RDK9_ARMOS|nr:uncharacterized protein ARMOST_10176 [Armillaria ostoyae]
MTMAYSPDLVDYACVGLSITIAPHVAQHSDVRLTNDIGTGVTVDVASSAATTVGSEPVDVLEKICLLEIVWVGEREELNNDLVQARHQSNELEENRQAALVRIAQLQAALDDVEDRLARAVRKDVDNDLGPEHAEYREGLVGLANAGKCKMCRTLMWAAVIFVDCRDVVCVACAHKALSQQKDQPRFDRFLFHPAMTAEWTCPVCHSWVIECPKPLPILSAVAMAVTSLQSPSAGHGRFVMSDKALMEFFREEEDSAMLA